VLELDALKDSGPTSLAGVVSELEPARGLAIVSEGLLSYLSGHQVAELWRRAADGLAGFGQGRYLFDLGIGRAMTDISAHAFRVALGTFVRGRVHEHFPDDEAAIAALLDAGFDEARIVRPDRSQPSRSPRLGDARTGS